MTMIKASKRKRTTNKPTIRRMKMNKAKQETTIKQTKKRRSTMTLQTIRRTTINKATKRKRQLGIKKENNE